MTRILSASDAKAPATREFTGRDKIVDCALYVEGVRQPGEWTPEEALEAARAESRAFVWVGLHEPSLQTMAKIADTYGLHELAVEDAVNAEQRPKLELFGEINFMVLRTARYVQHTELTENTQVVETGHVMLFIGPEFVVTVRHGDACRLSPVRARLEKRKELLAQGPWAVAYAIADHVVDLYVDVSDQIENDLDDLENQVFGRSQRHGRIQQIYQMKRELVEFKRAVVPLLRPLTQLTESTNRHVPKEVRRFFRDVQDHNIRVAEQVNGYDDLLNSILQARLAQVSVEQNNDMRKIASWAAIFAVGTFIAGIYGMNFDFMPELGWRYGYPGALTLMLVAALVLYRSFRRSGWL